MKKFIYHIARGMFCGSILLLVCILLLDAQPGTASETSLLDTIKNVDEPFDGTLHGGRVYRLCIEMQRAFSDMGPH